MSQALDYSTARPDPAAIVAAGFSGVLRYLAPIPSSPPGYGGADDSAKVIFGPEYAAIHAAGLELALNWEWYGDRAREGAIAGLNDAREAQRQADALGYLGPRPIYFSVDYNAPPADQFMINAYFMAAAQVIGLNRLGAYGGYWPLSRLFDAGLISYGWQALAWSGNNREARAHLFQNGAVALGGDVDDILRPDWAGGAMIPKGSLVGYLAGTDFDDTYTGNMLATTFGITYPDIVAIDDGQGHDNAWMGAYDPGIPGNYHGHIVYLPGFPHTTVTGRPTLTVRGDGLVQATCQ